MYSLPGFGLDPVGDLRAGPLAAIWRWVLERLLKLVLLLNREERLGTCVVMAQISESHRTGCAVAVSDLPHPARAIAGGRRNLVNRHLANQKRNDPTMALLHSGGCGVAACVARLVTKLWSTAGRGRQSLVYTRSEKQAFTMHHECDLSLRAELRAAMPAYDFPACRSRRSGA